MVAENKAEKNHATLITTYPKGGGVSTLHELSCSSVAQ